MRLLRSVASVVLSYVVVYGIVWCSGPILTHFYPTQYVQGRVPPVFLMWISTAIFAAASILGGWLCVRIAPFRPGGHLFVLFLLGELVGGYFSWHMWSTWPHWYSIVWLIVWPVCLWMGGLGKRTEPVPRFAT